MAMAEQAACWFCCVVILFICVVSLYAHAVFVIWNFIALISVETLARARAVVHGGTLNVCSTINARERNSLINSRNCCWMR